MRRNVLHLTIDIVLFLTVLGLMTTGLHIAFVLPPGSRGDTVWSMTRHDWGDVHFWMALAMFAAVVVHLILNWSWVCIVSVKLFDRRATAPSHAKRHLAGAVVVGALVLLVGGFLLAANQSKVVDPNNGPGYQRQHLENDNDFELTPLDDEIFRRGDGRGGGRGREQRDNPDGE